jgi:MoxR-like ATPase
MTDRARFRGTDSYLTNQSLEAAVDCALALQKPLLVRGEPGTGKTLLAYAAAEALDMELLTWNVKSTTRAQDGLYVYDTVQRLYDSRFGDNDVRDIRNYIRLGPLGQAFGKDKRVILLIDEIDKADIEFPNVMGSNGDVGAEGAIRGTTEGGAKAMGCRREDSRFE